MNPTNQPVSFYGDNSRNTDSALLAALATKEYAAGDVGMVAAGGVCDLREAVGNTKYVVKDAESNLRADIKEAEADIRRDIAKAEADIRADVLREGQENMAATKDAQCAILEKVGNAECAIIKEVLETKHSLAKDILRSEYENKLALQTALKEIKENAQHNAERTQDKTSHGFEVLHRNTDEIKADLKHGFFHAREEGLEEKVFKLSQDLQTERIVSKICCGCNESDAPGNSGK